MINSGRKGVLYSKYWDLPYTWVKVKPNKFLISKEYCIKYETFSGFGENTRIVSISSYESNHFTLLSTQGWILNHVNIEVCETYELFKRILIRITDKEGDYAWFNLNILGININMISPDDCFISFITYGLKDGIRAFKMISSQYQCLREVRKLYKPI